MQEKEGKEMTVNGYIDHKVFPKIDKTELNGHQSLLENNIHRCLVYTLSERLAKVTITSLGPRYSIGDLDRAYVACCDRVTLKYDKYEYRDHISVRFDELIHCTPHYLSPRSPEDYKEVLALLDLMVSRQKNRDDEPWTPLILAIVASAVDYQMRRSDFEPDIPNLNQYIQSESIKNMETLLTGFSLAENEDSSP